MTEWPMLAVTIQGKFLGIEWHVWKVIGWLGNICFFSRFIVQWYATERRQQVVIPAAFWWLSLSGCLCLLSYASFYQRDSVFIFANAFSWIPYLRNLMIHHRSKRAARACVECGVRSHSKANFLRGLRHPAAHPLIGRRPGSRGMCEILDRAVNLFVRRSIPFPWELSSIVLCSRGWLRCAFR